MHSDVMQAPRLLAKFILIICLCKNTRCLWIKVKTEKNNVTFKVNLEVLMYIYIHQ